MTLIPDAWMGWGVSGLDSASAVPESQSAELVIGGCPHLFPPGLTPCSTLLAICPGVYLTIQHASYILSAPIPFMSRLGDVFQGYLPDLTPPETPK